MEAAMTTKKKFDVGFAMDYTTRPVPLKTYLLIDPYFENQVSGETTCTWHIELCGQSDHDEKITGNDPTHRVDISAAGALVTVRNTGGWPFYAWTDY
jgi:hypothetical protein